MELSFYWEANSCSATQGFTNIFWNYKVHYSLYKSPRLVLIPSQLTPVDITPFYFCKTNFNIILSSTSVFLVVFFLPASHEDPPRILLPIYATRPAHLRSLAMSISYEASQHVIFSSFPLFNPSWVQIISSAPCPQNSLSSCSFHNIRDQVSRPYQTRGSIAVLCTLMFMFLDSRREETEW
jgi:hypothetical protein